jgi:hypothetical protein
MVKAHSVQLIRQSVLVGNKVRGRFHSWRQTVSYLEQKVATNIKAFFVDEEEDLPDKQASEERSNHKSDIDDILEDATTSRMFISCVYVGIILAIRDL